MAFLTMIQRTIDPIGIEQGFFNKESTTDDFFNKKFKQHSTTTTRRIIQQWRYLKRKKESGRDFGYILTSVFEIPQFNTGPRGRGGN
jgi:hypothetical protein